MAFVGQLLQQARITLGREMGAQEFQAVQIGGQFCRSRGGKSFQ